MPHDFVALHTALGTFQYLSNALNAEMASGQIESSLESERRKIGSLVNPLLESACSIVTVILDSLYDIDWSIALTDNAVFDLTVRVDDLEARVAALENPA